MPSFKQRHPFEERLNESTRIRDKFPGRVPLIVERAPNNYQVPQIDKEKFLVPGDLTVSQFLFVLRNRMKLSSEKALFIFIGGSLPITSSLMRELYAYHKDNDGFMYAVYSGENTFGSLN
jgi:GABA(A) receptor-associated protein